MQDQDNQIRAIQYENVDLQGEIQEKDHEIAVLQRRYVDYPVNEDKSNGITLRRTWKYPHISICMYN